MHVQALVLVSWMELGQDWSDVFRQCKSVREYILIGETDDGACGHPWKTWGHSFDGDGGDRGGVATTAAETAEETSAASAPPYAMDGFERVGLHALSELQLGKFDEPWQKHSPRMGQDGMLAPWSSWSREWLSFLARTWRALACLVCFIRNGWSALVNMTDEHACVMCLADTVSFRRKEKAR